MKRGLVIGKFLPLHIGHMALIDYALAHCDELEVVIGASDDEPIPGEVRLEWLKQTYAGNNKVKPILLSYDEAMLTGHAESIENMSRLWASYLKKSLPPIDVIFASESYGAYMGRFLDCESVIYEEPCKIVPVPAAKIREEPASYWHLLPDAVQDYYKNQAE
ncbi:adenylyltransferase/cytidyltransferase family protein [Mucilaginibacter sp. cycad4]|uniref:adenylyltransferase/cytidyltransferase family protein n=1 Tax=Mucilaginibacter sp. cycad4 TaxID=3342096 RepID=UPI002AAC3A51|nr:adenylyltransferase/cytidyltransferase family protein [Mucilaginibacter gossypii]WPU98251.1 adenylyltransferase/cytidyltransferase family protein [Mucilaginibacter gossypii]